MKEKTEKEKKAKKEEPKMVEEKTTKNNDKKIIIIGLVVIVVIISITVISVALILNGRNEVKDETIESRNSSVGTNESKNNSVTIKSSPDKYTWYIKNYVGKNLASFGSTSIYGYRRDEYGQGYIKLVINSKDGSYVDVNDKDDLKKYTVISQSVEPNTELKYTFFTYSDGTEADYCINTQSIEEIELTVEKNK